jgi:hypothetical protein
LTTAHAKATVMMTAIKISRILANLICWQRWHTLLIQYVCREQ